jgi:hypothetical protein
MDLGYVQAVDMNSNGGQPVLCYKPTLTNTLNWVALTPIVNLGISGGVAVPFFAG